MPALPSSVLWLAQDEGFYQREGLDVTLVELSGGPLVVSGLLNGSLDVGDVASEDVLRLAATGLADLRALHSSDPRLHFLIVSRCRVRELDDLRGGLFAIARVGSADDLLSRRVLAAYGLAPESLRVVSLGEPVNRGQAIAAGSVDATTVSIATWASLRHTAQLHVLVDQQAYEARVPLVQKVNANLASTLGSKREALRRFTTALLRASRVFGHDVQAWVTAVRHRRPDLEPADLDWLWRQFAGEWMADDAAQAPRYAQTGEFLYQQPDYRDLPRVPVSAWADDVLFREAVTAASQDAWQFDSALGRPAPPGPTAQRGEGTPNLCAA